MPSSLSPLFMLYLKHSFTLRTQKPSENQETLYIIDYLFKSLCG